LKDSKDRKCKTCGHGLAGRLGLGLDEAISNGGGDHDYIMNDDDDMKLGLLDELKESMGSGIDGNIKIIIASRGKPRKG